MTLWRISFESITGTEKYDKHVLTRHIGKVPVLPNQDFDKVKAFGENWAGASQFPRVFMVGIELVAHAIDEILEVG